MKVQLSLENFQSISKADLEFSTGINLISGSNSSGKTAILRALYAILTNPSHAKRYIKHGESHTTVKLELPDYNQYIEWTRKESGVKYIINGSENTKCGRNTLFDFSDDIPFIYDDAQGTVLNLQTEHDGLFPFNRSNIDMFRLFEDIFQISDSSTIMTAIKKDEQETNKKVSLLKTKEKEIENKLGYLTEFNSNYDYNDIEQHKTKCHSALSDLVILDTSLKTGLLLHKDIENIEVPDKQDYDLSVVIEYISLQDSLLTIKELSIFINQTKDLKKEEHDLTPVQGFFDIENALQEAQRLEEIQSISINTLDVDLFVIEGLLNMNYDEIEVLVSEMKSIKSNIDSLKSEKQGIQSELSLISVCPLCEQHLPDKDCVSSSVV